MLDLFRGARRDLRSSWERNLKISKKSHIVTMISETNPAQKASVLHVGVAGKTLQRTAIHDRSVFTFFLRIASLATARGTGLDEPVVALMFFSQQRHGKAFTLTVYFQALKIHLEYT